MIFPHKIAAPTAQHQPIMSNRLEDFVHVLQHASKCSNADCRISCKRMKLVIAHFSQCQHCEICRKFFSAVFYHSSSCVKHNCRTRFCNQTKQRIQAALSVSQ